MLTEYVADFCLSLLIDMIGEDKAVIQRMTYVISNIAFIQINKTIFKKKWGYELLEYSDTIRNN